jgi:hypothetical protein
MKSFDTDILVVGHAVYDCLYDGTDYPVFRWGGIFNVKRALDFIRCRFSYIIEPICFGNAFIGIDKRKASKSVIANLNKEVRAPKAYSSRWVHVAYANELDPEYIPKKIEEETVVSIDLCASKDKTVSNYEAEYIFASEDEVDVSSLLEANSRSSIILHSSKMATLYENKKMKCFKNKPLRNINIVGAGDSLAACFINYRLSGLSSEDSLKLSIEATQNFLVKN